MACIWLNSKIPPTLVDPSRQRKEGDQINEQKLLVSFVFALHTRAIAFGSQGGSADQFGSVIGIVDWNIPAPLISKFRYSDSSWPTRQRFSWCHYILALLFLFGGGQSRSRRRPTGRQTNRGRERGPDLKFCMKSP